MITSLALDDDGRPVLETEDDDGNRERTRVGPDEVPPALEEAYRRLRTDHLDALEGGHEAEAWHAYWWGVGAI